jgi:protein-disulfide isomerase
MARTLEPPLGADDHVRGPDEAPLELVMFGDFQCPYCLASQSILARVRDRVGDRLRLAFRHLPIVERHPLAQLAAEASEVAAARGRFWDCHDGLYAAQAELSERTIVDVVAGLGVERAVVEEELREGRFRERVERDVRSAQASGVQGTPGFFVNGLRHEDAYDAGTLVEALTAG